MDSHHNPPVPRMHSGSGRIALSSYGSNAVFSELSSTYPLKLLSPRVNQDGVAVVYVLTYGGGLVGGDQVNLSVSIDTGAVLVLLSQGSTKVFKTRQGRRLASAQNDQSALFTSAISSSPEIPLITMQNMDFVVAAESALFLLPGPVTCFRSASYNQIQTFHLLGNASLVVLDWLTSGRKSMGEEWAFSRYYSANDVWIDGTRIAKDVVLLDDQEIDLGTKLPPRTLRDKLASYACYAMVILCGPLVQGTIGDITAKYDEISVFKTKDPAEIVWSLSPITSRGGSGAVVRIAGKETETVKKWLAHALVRLQEVVGIDVYRRAFA